jgi:DNA-binding response OmpR family regulator
LLPWRASGNSPSPNLDLRNLASDLHTNRAFLAIEPNVLAEQETMNTEPQNAPQPDGDPLRVLLVDNDEDITGLVQAILTDEGYAVTSLNETDHASVAAAVGRVEPDCILLDSAEGPAFGGSWGEAAYLSRRDRAVPAVMFTAHASAVAEARDRETERAREADFAAIVPKPFSLDELLDAVGTAAGRSQRFNHSEAADQERTAELVRQLRDAGATDIRTSERREWATFVSPRDGRLHQLYWWQTKGLYMIGRYDEDARLEMIGQHFERSAAIDAALGLSTR